MTQTRTTRAKTTQTRTTQPDAGAEIPYANEVRICGRVAAPPVVRVMPSGDEMTTFRVIVRRPPSAMRRSKVTVDTVDCVAWTAGARRSASRLAPEDVVEVTGALRRRFQRAGDGPVSRVDVEVSRCRRMTVPARRPPASASGA